jgi:hypothetical protein
MQPEAGSFFRALRIATIDVPGKVPVRLDVVQGSVSQVRVAVPRSDGCARFRLYELLVQVPLDRDGADETLLHTLAASSTMVTACVAHAKDGGTQLCWLTDGAARSIVPQAYDSGERDWRSLRKSGPIAIVSTAAIAICIRYLFAGGPWMILALVASCTALMFSLAAASFSLLSLGIARRNRPVLMRAAQLWEKYGAKQPGAGSHG